MGSSGKFKTEILKETVIEGYGFDLGVILVQVKESCKGLSIYKVYSGDYYDEEYSELEEVFATHSREEADSFFFMLEREYPEEELIRKIF